MDSNPSGKTDSDLRQSLESLLGTDFVALHAHINRLQAQLDSVDGLSAPLPEEVDQLRKTLQSLTEESRKIEQQITVLQANLSEPDQVTDLVRRGLSPALQQDIKQRTNHYGEIIAPIISPAITNQIRNAQPEMVAALYPIIGKTIGKAISEAMQDLRRRIDANLKRNLNISQVIYRFRARLRGVSASELILRESMGYKIHHVLLIHRETGLLIEQVSRAEEAQDSDIFSAMLTAIRDFARDTFGSREEDLEEIQFGDSHILLRNGLYAYLAVVIEGIQPAGYASLMQSVIHQINLTYGNELRQFSGEMNTLGGCRDELKTLLEPSEKEMQVMESQVALSRGQKNLIGLGVVGVLLLIGLLIFGCIFSYRLLPVAFPASTQTPTLVFTSTPTPTATNTITPSPTFTPTPSPTRTTTPTPTPTWTSTTTQSPSPTPSIQMKVTGLMLGNVWVRPIPEEAFHFYAVVPDGTLVEIQAAYSSWVKITWETETGIAEGWVRSRWVQITGEIPLWLITPVE